MIKLMNSAMMPQVGHYDLVKITQEEFVSALRDSGQCNSYVGYEQTAKFVERISGVKVEVSRRPTILSDGERVLIIKLDYRLQVASTKGALIDEDNYEFYAMRYNA